MSTGHFSPQSSLPPLSQKVINTTTWGGGGTTTIITDPYIVSNSIVLVQVTGSTPSAGNWSYTYSEGSFVITSSASESSSLPIQYIIL